MTSSAAIAFAVALPLVGAVLVSLNDRHPNIREAVTLITAACLFLVVASLLPEVMAGGRPELILFDIMPGLPVRLEVEPLGMLFALVGSGLWFFTSLYSIGYMRGHDEQNQTRFYACFAIALAATMGVAFAGNMLTLFIFYEVLTLSTYPLVIHAETAEARRAGRTYLGILLGTSIGFLLLGVIWTWTITGTLRFTPGGILAGKADGPVVGVLLFLYAFGIGKAALMPFHRWLPAAMVAPTPVSALLHAVAVVKAGVFTVVKVMVYIFGIDFMADGGYSIWLQYVAGFTILAASVVALTKDNLKARLAYSTVSQLAYIVLGAALATGLSVTGSGMHIAMHAFGKITLFFCAGAILVASHKTDISEMDGLGRTMPITFFAFFVAALSITGLPPLGGSWSKWYLMLGAMEADKVVFVIVLMVSSLLNVAYLMPIVARGFFLPPRDDGGHPPPPHAHFSLAGGRIREAPLFCLVPLSFTAAGCVALFFYADEIFRLLEPMVKP